MTSAAVLGRRALLVAGVGGIAGLVGLAPPGARAADARRVRPALYVLGDSWAAGLHADPTQALGQVAAQALGLRALVDAVSGTGYLNAVQGGAAYPVRAAAAPSGTAADGIRAVVLQGGSNDDGRPHDEIPAALAATTAAVRARMPRARVLVLGPGPDPQPVTAVQADVDRVLQAAAASLGVAYVSMLQQDWIPAGSAVLDPANHHPTVAGQRYLGRRLAGALRARFPDLTA